MVNERADDPAAAPLNVDSPTTFPSFARVPHQHGVAPCLDRANQRLARDVL
jgi:hypothetical protein